MAEGKAYPCFCSEEDLEELTGTFTIKISAMIRVYNSSTGTWTEYIKTYKLKFVGSLTS